MRSKWSGMGAKKRLISKQYSILFASSSQPLSISFFDFHFPPSHHWLCLCVYTRFDDGDGVIVAVVSFYGAFVVFVRSTVALLFQLVYFFVLSLSCSSSRTPLLLLLPLWSKKWICAMFICYTNTSLSSLPVCVSKCRYYWHLAGWRWIFVWSNS